MSGEQKDQMIQLGAFTFARPAGDRVVISAATARIPRRRLSDEETIALARFLVRDEALMHEVEATGRSVEAAGRSEKPRLSTQIKEINQVLESLGELIATALWLSVSSDEDTESVEHARKMAGIHTSQLCTFLVQCVGAAQEGKAEELLKIIEDWKDA